MFGRPLAQCNHSLFDKQTKKKIKTTNICCHFSTHNNLFVYSTSFQGKERKKRISSVFLFSSFSKHLGVSRLKLANWNPISVSHVDVKNGITLVITLLFAAPQYVHQQEGRAKNKAWNWTQPFCNGNLVFKLLYQKAASIFRHPSYFG